jgi:hypothetical protein
MIDKNLVGEGLRSLWLVLSLGGILACPGRGGAGAPAGIESSVQAQAIVDDSIELRLLPGNVLLGSDAVVTLVVWNTGSPRRLNLAPQRFSWEVRSPDGAVLNPRVHIPETPQVGDRSEFLLPHAGGAIFSVDLTCFSSPYLSGRACEWSYDLSRPGHYQVTVTYEAPTPPDTPQSNSGERMMRATSTIVVSAGTH